MEVTLEDIAAMKPDELGKYCATLSNVPLPEYQGVEYPSFIPFRFKGAEKAIKDIMEFPSRESDILICTYAKGGGHWTYEVIKMLLENTNELRKDLKAHTMLELLPSLSVLDNLPPKRVLNTHLKFKYLPRKHIENRGKIVHTMRNPKDILVSAYYHAQNEKLFLNMKDITWDDMFEMWINNTKKLAYGSWYDYELEMERAENDNPGMIHTFYYEDMKKDPLSCIKKLAEFLEIKCIDQFIEEIIKATSFQNMKANKLDARAFIYRKGEIGDWKNHFTVSQNERFDAQFKERMKNSKYRFQFE